MKKIVCDFDGVLADTFEASVTFLSEKLRIPKERAHKRLIKDGLKNKKDRFLRKYITSWYYRFLLRYFKTQDDLAFTHHLKDLRKIQTSKAILTRNETAICKQVLSKYYTDFDPVIGRDNSKSKVDGIQKIAQAWNSALEDIIFVTDSVGDVKELQETLHAENIFVVSWGFQPPELIKKHLPDQKIINSFAELTPYLE
jgi:phosphoglycolate phosphatase-like HAD superfamily hydrolase